MTERIIKDIDDFKKRLTKAENDNNRADEGRAYCNLGNAYRSLGDFHRAIEYHNQDLRIAKEVSDKAAEGRAYGNLGNAYHSLGQFQRALECHKQDLSTAKEVSHRAAEGRAYGNLGNAYHSLGQFQRALECHKQDLSIAKEVSDRAAEGRSYGNLGNIYLYLDDVQRAFEYHKQDLSIAKEVSDRAAEGRSYGNLGNIYLYLGDLQRAIEYHKQSLSIAKEVSDRGAEGRAYGNLGKAYHSLDEFQRAIEYHKQDLSIAKEEGNRAAEGSAYCNLGLSLLKFDYLNEASAHFRSAVQTYETIRASFISEDAWKISFRKRCEDAYTYSWQVLIMLQKTDEALHAAEKGRAQALLDALKINYSFTSLSPRTDESEEDVTYISRKICALTVFLAIQNETINMWLLRKESIPIFRQAKLKIEGAQKDSFAAILVDTVLKNDCLQPLYEAVIGPIEDLLDGDELIVVPDGAFSLAPWSALCESLRIRTAPSLTTLNLITDSPDEYHCKSGALIVGDPCMKKVTNKWGQPIYDQLTYAKKEVEMIGKVLNSQPLTGEDATKQEVLRRIKSVALVHFAGPGRKETGEIFLAPNPEWESRTPMEEDYILTMSDIQAVKLRAKLVVIGCDHSGQGEVSSEGVVGMARAFLFAGARSVLASLWALHDEATMEFMIRFYKHLRAGETASTALQKAMKCLRDSDQFSAPKYWAPFVLIGDDVTIEFDENH